METRLLRDLVGSRVNLPWEQWAREHPHLAEVIDRSRLMEAAVSKLHHDPQFQQAWRAADLNEAQLAAALRIIEQAERWIGRLLPP